MWREEILRQEFKNESFFEILNKGHVDFCGFLDSPCFPFLPLAEIGPIINISSQMHELIRTAKRILLSSDRQRCCSNMSTHLLHCKITCGQFVATGGVMSSALANCLIAGLSTNPLSPLHQN